MPYQLTEAQKRRQELANEIRGLYDKAKAEKRSLTAEEAAHVDRRLGEIDQERTAEQREARVAELLEPRGEGRRSTPTDPLDELRGGARGAELDPDKGVAFRALDQEGREVRALTREGRVAAAFRDWRGPDGIRAHELNLGRALRAIATGNWRDAQAEQRVMLEGSDTAGGFAVAAPLAGQLIDLARNKSCLLQAGAITVPMTSRTLRVAKVTADPTPAWKAEGAEATASDMALGAIELQSRTLVAYTSISVELAEDGAGVQSALENSLAQQLGLEIDRAGLFGSGAGEEPSGIYNWETLNPGSGLNVVDMGTNGSAILGFEPFSEAVEACMEGNGTPSVVLYAPRTAGVVDRLQDGDGQPLAGPPSWVALRKLVSKQVATNLTHGSANNASAAFVGGFENVLWGVRTDIRLEVSRVADDAFKRGLVKLRAYLRGDIAVSRADQLCVITGIIP